MNRTSLSSTAFLLVFSALSGCARNSPATSPESANAPSPASRATMGDHTMMGGGGAMGSNMSNMMDGGQGMMAGQGMMGPGLMDGGMMDTMGMGEQCPMLLPGTSVQAQDTKDGVAMTFSTTSDVAELRRRVRAMADHMNAHASGTSGAMGMHGGMTGADAGVGMASGSMMGAHGMMGGGMMGGIMPAMHAQVEDVDHGARLTMTPADPARLNEMREHIKQHAQMMNRSHGCSAMVDAGR